MYFKRFCCNLGKKDSNLQPSDSESDALPIKLFPILKSYTIKCYYNKINDMIECVKILVEKEYIPKKKDN